MRISIDRRRGWLVAVMGISLLIASAMIPGPSGATMMEYTYTSPSFHHYEGIFPESPAIGYHLSISFLHNGVLPSGSATTDISGFTMSCGDLHLSSSTPGTWSLGTIFAVDESHLPTSWIFILKTDFSHIEPPHWWEATSHGGSTPHSQFDHVYAVSLMYDEFPPRPFLTSADYIDFWAAYFSQPPATGVWTFPGWQAPNPVPLPPAALLLGSGLIPLWWYRRRKTSAT